MMDRDTIFAVSSGAPPAAIAVLRISGPRAAGALAALAGRLPAPRRATLAMLRDPRDGAPLDRALALWFPGPGSATGEDMAELHVHGGRAVVAAVLAALGRLDGLRPALAGEFTRRSFDNGVLDLAEAEGLADLLAAETESQRRAALAMANGLLSQRIEAWQRAVLDAAARMEAVLDFADEGDVSDAQEALAREGAAQVAREIEALLAQPAADRLRDGIRVVLAGPPNAGKSTLLNALAERDAAIVAAVPGTTRDVIEAPVSLGGIAYLFTDTAGLRESGDEIERLGVGRARAAVGAADILLWLGEPGDAPAHPRCIRIYPRMDEPERRAGGAGADIALSAQSGEGMAALRKRLAEEARTLLPREDEPALHARHRAALRDCAEALAESPADPILFAESLRAASRALDRVTGRAGVEDMLDALFGRFCIGK